MKLKIKYIVFVFMIFLFACSAEKETQKDNQGKVEIEKPLFENSINININRVYAWINVMPNSPKRFNITGEISLMKTEDVDLKNVELKEIQIYQNGKEIYRINPTVRWKNENVTLRTFTFSTLKGLSLTPILNENKKMDALFLFDYDGDKLQYYVQAIPIEKAH